MKQKEDFSPVEVFAGTAWEAGLVKSMLEDMEIEAFLKDQIMGIMNPWYVTPGGFGSIKVVVAHQDEEKAKKVVEDYYRNIKQSE